MIEVQDQQATPDQRRYRLPAAHAEVLLARESLSYLAPFARLAVGVVEPLAQVVQAFRTGGGVPYSAYGRNVREGIADANRLLFTHLLGKDWLPSIPDVYERLQQPGARVADIGCGSGWSRINMARAYPTVHVDGFDLDEAPIADARCDMADSGVADRVSVAVRDAADPVFTGGYDLVTAFECLHDMAHPGEALRAMRGLTAPGASVIIADERVHESFEAPGDQIERLNYGFSVLHCLPVGMADQPSAGTGTVMRPQTLRDYADTAGYRGVEVLPIENDFWRFSRLQP